MVEPALEPGCIGNPQYDFKTSPKHENLEIPVAREINILGANLLHRRFEGSNATPKQIKFCFNKGFPE